MSWCESAAGNIHRAMKKLDQTVTSLGLNHRDCGSGIGINGRPTAGQGPMDWAGAWKIPCPACAERVAFAMTVALQQVPKKPQGRRSIPAAGNSLDKRRR